MPPSTTKTPTAESALFIADLHLSPATPELTQRFEHLLAGLARQVGQLFILGDLFDAWAGDDDLDDPFNARIVAALRAAAEAGTAIAFLAGNRDFLICADFAAAAGIERLPDPYRCEIAGQSALLTHGDALCTDDADYQRFRATVRDPAWRAAFLARPLAERKRLIADLRAQSEAEKQTKPAAIMDVNAGAVEAVLRETGARLLIHGHTHRQGRHALLVDGRPGERWVLGDWHATHGNALSMKGDTLTFLSL